MSPAARWQRGHSFAKAAAVEHQRASSTAPSKDHAISSRAAPPALTKVEHQRGSLPTSSTAAPSQGHASSPRAAPPALTKADRSPSPSPALPSAYAATSRSVARLSPEPGGSSPRTRRYVGTLTRSQEGPADLPPGGTVYQAPTPRMKLCSPVAPSTSLEVPPKTGAPCEPSSTLARSRAPALRRIKPLERLRVCATWAVQISHWQEPEDETFSNEPSPSHSLEALGPLGGYSGCDHDAQEPEHRDSKHNLKINSSPAAPASRLCLSGSYQRPTVTHARAAAEVVGAHRPEHPQPACPSESKSGVARLPGIRGLGKCC